jgi:hypothetical protein
MTTSTTELRTITPVDITNENFKEWGQVVRLPDADPNAVQVNQGTLYPPASVNGVPPSLFYTLAPWLHGYTM